METRNEREAGKRRCREHRYYSPRCDGAAVALVIRGCCAAVFKIPSAPAHRRTVRDFEARSAIAVNAGNIAIFSWGASNPRHHRLFPIAVVRQPTPLFLRAPVCTYVIEYVSSWLARSSTSPPSTPNSVLFFSPLFPLSRALESDGNTDRIRVICGDILTRAEYGVTSLSSPPLPSPRPLPRRFILDWIFGGRSVQSRLRT